MEIEKIPSVDELLNLSEITEDKVLLISEIVKNKPKNIDRFSCGFKIFDEVMLGGFKEGDLIVISGVSGQGKTTMAQTLTYNLCKNAVPCLWFSYEVSLTELNRKFELMGIDNFYWAYAPEKNTTGKIDWIKYKIREGWIKYATKVVFIDHIDFLTPMTIRTSDNETVAFKKIMTELKSLAIELDIVIVIMAHLKKLREGQEPDMQDIGYSAGIFQLADYVFMIFREQNKEYKSFNSKNYTGEINTNNSIIKLVKNRQTGQNKFLKVIYNNGKFMPLEEKYEENSIDASRIEYLQR